MKGYADLLREAQAHQNAEARAEKAEQKLAKIEALCVAAEAALSAYPNAAIDAEDIRQILESDA